MNLVESWLIKRQKLGLPFFCPLSSIFLSFMAHDGCYSQSLQLCDGKSTQHHTSL